MKHAAGPYMIVGLVGRAGAGKDTCAQILADAQAFATVAFADALRRELVGAFGIDPRLFANRTTKEQVQPALALGRANEPRFIELMRALGEDLTRPRSPRGLMRLWGTQYRRALDGENYWLMRLHETVEALQGQGWRRIAITDIRFLNEAAFTRDIGGTTWRIHRRLADAVPPDHDSEAEVDQITPDLRFHNDGTVSALVYDVLCAYEQTLFLNGPGRSKPEPIVGIFHADHSDSAAR